MISLLENLIFSAKAAFNETLWNIFKNIIHESKDIFNDIENKNEHYYSSIKYFLLP